MDKDLAEVEGQPVRGNSWPTRSPDADRDVNRIHSQLRSVVGIHDNSSLASLADMSSLEIVNADLSIYGNECLSQADAEAFTTSIEVGGSADVYDNGANYPCP